MSFQNQPPRVCCQCVEELESYLIEHNNPGGPSKSLSSAHVLVFPEGEYALRTQHPGGTENCELVISVSIRAFPPGLGTWWASWTVPVDTHPGMGSLVAAEIVDARERFLTMLQEHGERVAS